MDSIIEVFCDPKRYLDIFTENAENAYNTMYNNIPNINIPNIDTIVTSINDNFSNVITSVNDFNFNDFNFNNFNNNKDILNLNMITICIISSVLTFIIGMQIFNNNDNRLIELYKMCIKENKILNSEKLNDEKLNDEKLNNKTNKTNENSKDIIPNNKFYLKSLNEVHKNNDVIKSKLIIDNNYIVILRVKTKNYLPMRNTNYELHSKNNKSNKSNKYNDFITKDMYMIMGFNYNNLNKDDSITNIIISSMNYLNHMSDEIYKN